jgi:SHS2 domain-containing protein
MPSKVYEYLEHTADLRFRSFGRTLGECFANAGKAVFSYILDLSTVDDQVEKVIELSAPTPEMLLHDYLSEMLYLFETENFVCSGFHVSVKHEKEGYVLSARVSGETVDPARHVMLGDVKAVTYHELSVKRENDLFVAEVLCDT